MKILKTVQKVPGGMMVIPLLLGVILNTVCPSLLQAGGYVTALWSSGGANTAIAIFLFCVGAQIQLRQGGQILKRGFVLLFAKFLAGAVLGWVIGAIFGTAGVLGLSSARSPTPTAACSCPWPELSAMIPTSRPRPF